VATRAQLHAEGVPLPGTSKYYSSRSGKTCKPRSLLRNIGVERREEVVDLDVFHDERYTGGREGELRGSETKWRTLGGREEDGSDSK
jgi:hypothetical protein